MLEDRNPIPPATFGANLPSLPRGGAGALPNACVIYDRLGPESQMASTQRHSTNYSTSTQRFGPPAKIWKRILVTMRTQTEHQRHCRRQKYASEASLCTFISAVLAYIIKSEPGAFHWPQPAGNQSVANTMFTVSSNPCRQRFTSHGQRRAKV